MLNKIVESVERKPRQGIVSVLVGLVDETRDHWTHLLKPNFVLLQGSIPCLALEARTERKAVIVKCKSVGSKLSEIRCEAVTSKTGVAGSNPVASIKKTKEEFN